MDVALIPPISLLDETDGTTLQLMLPQLLWNQKYADTYLQHCMSDDQYVIMDNGAAENHPIDHEELVHKALEFEPNELALPDVLGESAQTIVRSREFHRKYSDLLLHRDIQLGVVAQGHDVVEAQYTVDRFADIFGTSIKTIYLPRLLVTHETPTARIELARRIYETHGDKYQIHLFGCSRYWPAEVVAAKRYHYIRSIDTSLPFNYAYYGRLLKGGAEANPVHRSDDYFMASGKKFGGYQINVERFMLWAK